MATAKLLIAFIVIVVLQYADLAGLQFKVTPVDGTFPFQPLNNNVSSIHLIGTVGVTQNIFPQHTLKFALLNITYISPQGVKQVVRIGDSFDTAMNTSIVECLDDSVISSYPDIRNYFCMYHSSGQIYTTKYFKAAEHPSGSSYQFQIRYILPNIGLQQYETNPWSVEIISNCDKSTNIYLQMDSLCDHSIFILRPVSEQSEQLNSTFTIPLQPLNTSQALYLSNIVVNFSLAKSNTVTFKEPTYQSKINMEVKYLGNTAKTTAYYLGSKLVNFNIKLPFNVVQSEFITLTLTDNVNNALKFYQSWISAIFVDQIDFCGSSNGNSCSTLLTQYNTAFSLVVTECPDADLEFSFQAKYGHCKENEAPVQTNFTAVIDWDVIDMSNVPTSVISNYVSDKDSLNSLSYTLTKIQAKYSNNPLLDYFEIRKKNDGEIFTKLEIRKNLLPDDELTLTVDVKDVVKYPPRLLNASIAVTFTSICKDILAAFRKIFESDECKKAISLSTMSDAQSNSVLQSSYNVKIATPNTTDTTDEFYMVSLYWNMFNLVPSIDYVLFELSCNGENVTAKIYLNGIIHLFSKPMKYDATCSYTLKALKDGTEPYPFSLQNYKIISIKKMDYCSKKKCVDLYKIYDEAYQSNSSLIAKHCANPDQFGWKAKYGYCQETFSVSGDTDYKINIGIPYEEIEVVPGSGEMYVTNSLSPVEYQIMDVKWEDGGTIIITPGGVSDSYQPPKACDQSFTSKPKSFFCINSKTGVVFTTSVIDNQLSGSSKFVITVKVSDTTFPFTTAQVNLTLTTEKICLASYNLYNDLTSCQEPYKLLQRDNEYDSPLRIQFDLANLVYEKLIGVTFDKHKLFRDKYYKYIRMEVAMIKPSTGGNPVSSVNKIMTLKTNVTSLKTYSATLELNLTPNKDEKLLTIEFFGSDSLNGEDYRISPSTHAYNLTYLVHYACASKCSALYKRWTKGPTECLLDHDLLKINYVECINPSVKMLTIPTISGAFETGKEITISNCKYSNSFKMPKFYWLKDNTTEIEATENDFQEVGNEYTERSLKINSASAVNQGLYQCVVETFDGEQKFKSDKVYLKLEDVSESIVNTEIVDLLTGGDVNDKAYQLTLAKRIEETVKAEIIAKSQMTGDLIVKVTSINPVQGDESNKRVAVVIQVTFSALTGNDRENLCKDRLNSLQKGQILNIEIKDLSKKSLDCCPVDITGEINYKGVYNYTRTLADRTATKACVYNNVTRVDRLCVINLPNLPYWKKLNDTVCVPKTETTKKLLEISGITVDANNVQNVSSNLNNIVTTGNLTNTKDIEIITDLVEEIVNTNVTEGQVPNDVLDVVDNFLETEPDIITKSNRQSRTSYTVLRVLDKLALNLIKQTNAQRFRQRNFALSIAETNANTRNLTFIATDNQSSIVLESIVGVVTPEELTSDASIYLPREVFETANGSQVFSYIFRSGVLFLADSNNLVPQSVVISSTVDSTKIVDLNEKIEVILRVVNNTATIDGYENFCKFWDPESGNWSTNGCETFATDRPNYIKCKCSHLTNFALLLDVSQTGSNPLALQIVTWIGCGISLLGLFLTLLTYLLFSKLRRKLPAKILICLAASLLALLVIFLVGAEKTDPKTGCQVVAALIQYFMLTTFFWMSIEGLNLYRNFVKVFHGGSSSTSFMIKASIYAWGVPLVITLVTAIVAPDNLGPATSEDNQICVVRGLPFFLGVVVPIVMVMIENLIVLVLVIRGITDKQKAKGETKKDKRESIALVRIAFACTVLLGTTWIFGMLAVGDLKDIFQWLFCIFNSLQGFFLFIFYTLRNTEAVKQWKRCFGFKVMDRSSTMRSKSESDTQTSTFRSTKRFFTSRSKQSTKKIPLKNTSNGTP